MLTSPFQHIDSPSQGDFSLSKAMQFKSLEFINSPYEKSFRTGCSPFKLLPQEKFTSNSSGIDYKVLPSLPPLLHTPLHLRNAESKESKEHQVSVVKQEKRKISSFESTSYEDETEDSAKKEKIVCEPLPKQKESLAKLLSKDMEIEDLPEDKKIADGFQVRKKVKLEKGTCDKVQEETQAKGKGKAQKVEEKKHAELLESHFMYGFSKEMKETKEKFQETKKKLRKKQEKLPLIGEPDYNLESESEGEDYLLSSEEEKSCYSNDNTKMNSREEVTSVNLGSLKELELQALLSAHFKFNKTKKNAVKSLNTKRKHSNFDYELVDEETWKKFQLESPIFECSFCGKRFSKGRSLGGHVARVHKAEFKEKEEQRKNQGSFNE